MHYNFLYTLVNQKARCQLRSVWCNNDYLNMGQNSEVTNAMISAIHASGSGAGGTRNISGTTHYMTQLEYTLAKLHDKEAALVFSSGFVANEAALSTLPQLLTTANKKAAEDAAAGEEGVTCHASMIAGIRNSRVKKHIWRHVVYASLPSILSLHNAATYMTPYVSSILYNLMPVL